MSDNTNMTTQQRIDYLKSLSPQAWDAICKCCGICCLLKYVLPDGYTGYDNVACDNLDLKTKKCKCFDSRINPNTNCVKVDIDVVLKGHLQPTSCAYVEFIYGPAKFPAIVNFDEIVNESDRKLDMKSSLDSMDFILKSRRWNFK